MQNDMAHWLVSCSVSKLFVSDATRGRQPRFRPIRHAFRCSWCVRSGPPSETKFNIGIPRYSRVAGIAMFGFVLPIEGTAPTHETLGTCHQHFFFKGCVWSGMFFSLVQTLYIPLLYVFLQPQPMYVV